MNRKRDVDTDPHLAERSEASASVPTDEGAVVPSEPAEPKAIPTEDPDKSAVSEADQLRQRVAELEDRLLRAAADFDNYKKRQARLYDETVRAAADQVLTDLLGTVDNFQRALSNSGASDPQAFRQGIEMIFDQLKSLLAKYDVTPIESLGKPFSPNLHEALMQIPSDKHDEGTVALEMTPGWKRGDRVLRHAKVGVSSGRPDASDGSGQQ